MAAATLQEASGGALPAYAARVVVVDDAAGDVYRVVRTLDHPAG